ncbi:MAG: hypothetical protein A2V52_05085 [Actinobacteria bacterium RBG_19FT_COMBO_54_7]|nr:MAG: hypothetical protein A2V52_05085 [Actinobacteria bacterium RBG_19FT_COMBO_54_7]
MGAESGSFRTAGGTALRGLPPLAGFAWRWMEFQVLILAFASGSRILLIAALPLVFAGALIEGFLPVLWSPAETEKTPQFALHSTAVLLAVFLLALGLYPGSFTDLLMREYGIAINLPFAGWTSLGWAILICAVLAVIVLYLVHREKESARGPFLQGALPLVAGGPFPTFPTWKVLENRILAFAALALLFAFWAAALIYLGLK